MEHTLNDSDKPLFGAGINEQRQIVIVNKEYYLNKAYHFQCLLLTDDYRHPDAHRDGGFALNDTAVINKYRTAFKNLISEVGRQLISGKFNLTRFSFPISCMAPTSIV